MRDTRYHIDQTSDVICPDDLQKWIMIRGSGSLGCCDRDEGVDLIYRMLCSVFASADQASAVEGVRACEKGGRLALILVSLVLPHMFDRSEGLLFMVIRRYPLA